MAVWLCPACGRRFARANQGHECAPAMTLEDYFSTGPAHERPVFDAVVAHLAHLDDVHVEPVSVGIFLKRARTFAELRPMTRWVAVSFGLDRRATHRTITRKPLAYPVGFWHYANVRTPDEVDDALVSLLVESYDRTPGSRATGTRAAPRRRTAPASPPARPPGRRTTR